MNMRAIKRRYSGSALEAWLQRLDCDWEHYFERSSLERGQSLYREGAVREIELGEEDAIIHVRSDTTEGYAVIEWNGKGPTVRSSENDTAFGQMLATAGIYEIEELVADEAAPIPPETADKKPAEATEAAALLHPVNGTSMVQEPEQAAPPRREVEVVFYVNGSGLGFAAWLVDATDKRVPALGSGSEAAGELSGGERESLIRLASAARRAGFRYLKENDRYWLETLDAAPRFVQTELPNWRRHFKVVCPQEVQRLAKGAREARLSAQARLRDKGALAIDWLIELDGRKLSAGDARKLIHNGGSTVFLPDYGLAHLNRRAAETVESWRELSALFPDKKFPPYLAFSLFGSDDAVIEADAPVAAWRERMLKPSAAQLPATPKMLRDYQEHGVRWMHHLAQNDCHGLLADEMGLGKTLQVLSLIAAHEAKLPSLVVCPASVIPVWQDEVARFFPKMRVAVLGQGQAFGEVETDLWVASYSQIRRQKQQLAEVAFHFAILDEAQFIKNPEAKVTLACLAITARHRLALTGTPVENRLLDAWTLYRFLMPGLLGSRRRFESSLSRDPDETLGRLRRQIGPFVLRRTKAEVAGELPEKIHSEILCPMSGPQRAEYERLAREGLEKFGDNISAARREQGMSLLSLLTRLRQTCCDPGLLPWSKQSWEASGKTQLLLDRLEEVAASGRRAVVFSQFVRYLDRVRTACSQRLGEVEQFCLTGQTRDRAKPVQVFQALEGAGIMFISLKAGGTGITLTNADYVFLLDPWWNPAVEEQAIDRVHRIGRQEPVFVYRLVAAQSIEQRIQHMQASKRVLLNETLGDAASGSDFSAYEGSLSDLLAVIPERSKAHPTT